MSMLTLFESRYTLKGMYNIGNVGKTASMSMLTLFESRYTLVRECTTLVMLAQLLLLSMLNPFAGLRIDINMCLLDSRKYDTLQPHKQFLIVQQFLFS